ncbi:hypothetical protein [Parabacteroides gordonii]|uniref:Uncharacterized protein n=1 Tax=Parabacteroides gordonii MS-1 = DSM 23371 TaxID=1203610 RepID=A0A0F5JL89_9BACT|nr:hypothetical protein [Parabacteroides gordonii]KKB58355.1 hypothetical protein HMPREF1536_01230 [Parabacteroides gordonii MS-1 = DSM 23371]MCA5583375.1 hypothetical protein [Parabacteroides gordonii]
MIKRLLLIYLLWSCFTISVKATGQVGEIIIIGHDTLSMLSCPIEADSLISEEVQKQIRTFLSDEHFSTGCYRRYIGYWQLENNTLYLEKIRVYPDRHEGEQTFLKIDSIFGRYKEKESRITASWFSGELKVVSGKCVSYIHDGFLRDYEHERIYKIEQGKVISQAFYENSLQKARITKEEALQFIIQQFNKDLFPELKDIKVGCLFSLIPQKDGKIDSLIIHHITFGKEDISSERQQLFIQELRSCFNLIPEWDVITIHGKIQPTLSRWFIPLWRGKEFREKYRKTKKGTKFTT